MSANTGVAVNRKKGAPSDFEYHEPMRSCDDFDCDPGTWYPLAVANRLTENDTLLREELKRYGIPDECPLSTLLRHIYGNRDAAHGADQRTIAIYKERQARLIDVDDPKVRERIMDELKPERTNYRRPQDTCDAILAALKEVNDG